MEDMTVGSIRRHIIVFSFPLLIANLLQLANLFVNRVWAGKFLGEDAISAITVSMVVLYIMFSLAIGLTIGSSTVIAQYFGSKQEKKVGKAVALSFIIIMVIAAIMTFICIFFSGPLLKLMDTPYGIFIEAKNYLIISALGLIFLFGQVLIGFIFRAIGDSITPLIFSSISVVVNIILDPFIMLGIYPFPRLEVTGAAIALVISQAVAFFFAIYFLQKKGGIVSLRKKNFVYNKEIIKNILKLGVPTGIENIAISTGIGISQFFIDSFGTSAVASWAAVSVMINILLYISWSISAGVSVIAGQNMGAKNIERVKETLKEGLKICILFAIVITLISLLITQYYLLIFLQHSNTEAINIGIYGSRVLAIPYIFLTMLMIYGSLFNGVGDNISAMIITIIGIWVFRIPLLALSSRIYGIHGLWIGLGLSYVLSGAVAYFYYKTGRWKKKGIIK